MKKKEIECNTYDTIVKRTIQIMINKMIISVTLQDFLVYSYFR